MCVDCVSNSCRTPIDGAQSACSTCLQLGAPRDNIQCQSMRRPRPPVVALWTVDRTVGRSARRAGERMVGRVRAMDERASERTELPTRRRAAAATDPTGRQWEWPTPPLPPTHTHMTHLRHLNLHKAGKWRTKFKTSSTHTHTTHWIPWALSARRFPARSSLIGASVPGAASTKEDPHTDAQDAWRVLRGVSGRLARAELCAVSRARAKSVVARDNAGRSRRSWSSANCLEQSVARATLAAPQTRRQGGTLAPVTTW